MMQNPHTIDITHLAPLGRRIYKLIIQKRPEVLNQLVEAASNKLDQPLTKEAEYFESRRDFYNNQFEERFPMAHNEDRLHRLTRRESYVNQGVNNEIDAWISNIVFVA